MSRMGEMLPAMKLVPSVGRPEPSTALTGGGFDGAQHVSLLTKLSYIYI